ncbi:hypothetical protein LXL04_034504 [Taraxacum kok-saghyz]
MEEEPWATETLYHVNNFDLHYVESEVYVELKPLKAYNGSEVRVKGGSELLGYCFLGGNFVSWSSKPQLTVSMWNSVVENRGVGNTVAKSTWLRNVLRELCFLLPSATIVHCDNNNICHVFFWTTQFNGEHLSPIQTSPGIEALGRPGISMGKSPT